MSTAFTNHTPQRHRVTEWMLVLCVSVSLWPVSTFAQRGGGPAAPPPTPRAASPVDLTGTWVSIVTEDWRWRMVTPAKGDVSSVPVNDAARKIAMAWDPATDGSCLAYGAAAIMRIPGRLRISWENDSTLKIETDAGQQTRLLHFDASRPAPAERTLQGYSTAEWERPPAGRGAAAPLRWAPLRVNTRNLRAAWLRKNGVPYSENATVTEYFLFHNEGDAGDWLTVTTIVEDPAYLVQPFITSSDFKKEPNGSKWAPSPCKP
jgi:hypothetical protein